MAFASWQATIELRETDVSLQNLLGTGTKMEYREEYQGHVINAWTSAERPGRFIWSYTIDDDALVINQGKPQRAEQQMLDEAVDRARSAIDKYPK
jgi:predicted amino acid dehydrogenase